MQLCSSLNIFWHCPSLRLEWKLTFPVLWPLLSFPNLVAYEWDTFTASSFRIWNSSTGIPSPPPALFVVMLPKVHLTSHSRMSGSRWVITQSWLCGLWRSFLYSYSVYSCHLFLIISSDRVPKELWTEVCDIVQEAVIKTIPKKKKCKKTKWLSEEPFQIVEKRKEGKAKGEKERYIYLNAEFQRIARRDKKAFLSDQCK